MLLWGCLLVVARVALLEVLGGRRRRLLLARAVALHGRNLFYLGLGVQALPLLGAAAALPVRALVAPVAVCGAVALLLLILLVGVAGRAVRTRAFRGRALHSFYIL